LSKNRLLVPRERRRLIVEMIRKAGSVTVTELEMEFGISPMTARRDLAHLETNGQVERSHGGAVLPGFAGHEDSFQQRLSEAVQLKERLARAAVSLLDTREAVFIDSSTTAYYAARRVLDKGIRVTLLTNLVPMMELFSIREAPSVKLVGFGGELRQLTLSFVGPQTTQAIRVHFADKAFISVKGVTSEGYLTDPDPLEAEVKQVMVKRSREPILLVDGSKFEQRGLHAIGHITEFARVLAADVPSARLEILVEEGVDVMRV
jgi:DeoR/GlpR family transcriptional regulator of sugar metabolism